MTKTQRHAAHRSLTLIGVAIALAALPACRSSSSNPGPTTASPPPSSGQGTAATQANPPAAARPAPTRASVGSARESLVEAYEFEAADDLDAALSAFERAIEFNPTLTPAYIGAGEIMQSRGDARGAERMFGNAARLEPSNLDAQFGHGRALQSLGRESDAIRAYLRALSIDPSHGASNLNLSSVYLSAGEPGYALTYAQRAVALDSSSGEARINLAAAYAAQDRHDAAITEYLQAAELMELTPEMLLSLADSLGRLGRYAEMSSTLDELVRSSPTAAVYERLGSANFRMRRYGDALVAFRNALAIDPDHYPAMNGVAVCRLNTFLWSQKQDTPAIQEAVASMRSSLRLEPDQPQIIELLRRYGPWAG